MSRCRAFVEMVVVQNLGESSYQMQKPFRSHIISLLLASVVNPDCHSVLSDKRTIKYNVSKKKTVGTFIFSNFI